MLHKLWKDDAGFIISAELVLVATILVIGMIVGLVVIRNQVVQELVDVGQSIGRMAQCYEFSGIGKSTKGGMNFVAETQGSKYVDKTDFCQAPDIATQPPGGINIGIVGPGATPTMGETGW